MQRRGPISKVPFASVGTREKGDDDMAASGKLTQGEIGFDACRRMSNFHRDTFT